tara:strand:+ start:3648 stop:4355 length:708 start_codon:yes stop_codon:yes gene_type:complete
VAKYKTEFRKYVKNGNPKKFIKTLVDGKLDFAVRESSECTEVLLDDTHIVYASTSNFPRKKVFLFRLVNNEVLKWLDKNDIKMPEYNHSVEYNYEYDYEKEEMTGTDLNHAYWRIAYTTGLISEKTYIAGLDNDCKALRLATISTLGREKKFNNYKQGKIGKSFVYKKRNEKLQDVYKFVRLTCFKYMKEASKLLGDDFFAWKTDCIYYKNTKENIKMIQDYFDSKNLTYKQLGY